MNRLEKVIAAFLVIGTLAGCASISNEGASEFRRTDRSLEIPSPADALPKESVQRLQVKNLSLDSGNGDKRFAKGDSLSIHLRTAFIKHMTESPIPSVFTHFATRNMGKKNGEIAIVANALEHVGGKELNFSDLREGRVVFFSDDVHEDQFLNFNNMPVYGPLVYSGVPFALRLTIFEIDVQSEQVKAMLKTVASFGAKAYPPASPVLDILNGIGETFLGQDQIDTELRYAMVFDPESGVPSLNHFALETGNYVIIRSEKRGEAVPWDKLLLDENLGQVFLKKESGPNVPAVPAEKGEPYRQNTYVVVEINKNVSNVEVELAQNNFSSLIGALEQRDKERAEGWKPTRDALMRVATRRVQVVNFDRAKEILRQLEMEAPNPEHPKDSVSEKRVLATELFSLIAASVTIDADGIAVFEVSSTSPDQEHALAADQVQYLLARFRRIKTVNERLINDTALELLELKNIHSAFRQKQPDKTKRDSVLDLVAPFSSN